MAHLASSVDRDRRPLYQQQCECTIYRRASCYTTQQFSTEIKSNACTSRKHFIARHQPAANSNWPMMKLINVECTFYRLIVASFASRYFIAKQHAHEAGMQTQVTCMQETYATWHARVWQTCVSAGFCRGSCNTMTQNNRLNYVREWVSEQFLDGSSCAVTKHELRQILHLPTNTYKTAHLYCSWQTRATLLKSGSRILIRPTFILCSKLVITSDGSLKGRESDTIR